MLSRYQEGRRALLEARGVAVDEFADDQLTSADDVFFFPNMVGPIYPGIAIVFRVRPNGTDPDSCIKDTWFLHWPQEGEPPKRAKRRFFPDWTERDWGEITNQDYANMEHVQIGMKSRGGPRHPAEPPAGEQHLAHAPDDRPLPDHELTTPGSRRRSRHKVR